MIADWPYRSAQDLLNADFRFRGIIPCPVCGMRIAIYQRLDSMPVFVDMDPCWPHLRFKHEAPPEVDHKSAAAGER